MRPANESQATEGEEDRARLECIPESILDASVDGDDEEEDGGARAALATPPDARSSHMPMPPPKTPGLPRRSRSRRAHRISQYSSDVNLNDTVESEHEGAADHRRKTHFARFHFLATHGNGKEGRRVTLSPLVSGVWRQSSYSSGVVDPLENSQIEQARPDPDPGLMSQDTVEEGNEGDEAEEGGDGEEEEEGELQASQPEEIRHAHASENPSQVHSSGRFRGRRTMALT